MSPSTKSYRDLINDCDSFPYESTNPVYSSLYYFSLPKDPRPHGFMLASTVESMPWTRNFHIDHLQRTVQLCISDSSDVDYSRAANTALQELVDIAIEKDTFKVINQTHSEPYCIPGSLHPVSIERFACSLFGTVQRGAHMTCFTYVDGKMRIWVPRRSVTSFSYPNCLDTTVAGGVAAGESPYECIVREAEEEASLSAELVRLKIRATGLLTYIGQSEGLSGGEIGLIMPDMIYVYDLELPQDVTCRPHDDEVKEFYLMNVDEVCKALANGEFKTNSAFVMIDFLIRHGYIMPENEPHYAEITSRLHRNLPFPTSSEP